MPALLVLAACGSTKDPPLDVETDVTHPSPSRRMQAVAAVQRTGDTSQVPALIEMLDDPDPALRMAAHRTLVDLTGRESSYRPWASEAELRAAVLDWRQWLESP